MPRPTRSPRAAARLAFALLVFLAAAPVPRARAEEAKNHDFDVVRDESKVPPYQLPPLLVAADGTPVTTAAQWREVRRPELLGLFANLVYGVVPAPSSPLRTTATVARADRSFLGGTATRKDVRIRFENDRGSAEMLVLVFTPNDAKGPVPAFLHHSFTSTHDDGHDPDPARPGTLRCGVPLATILRRGFGYVAVWQGDLVRHNEVEFQKGIHPLFYRDGQSFPKANEWGVIAAVSWSASRALDYLQGDPDVDGRRVVAMGHSKMGKAALWSAARDERFAMAVLAQSGCAGAALWKRDFGETMEKMTTRFPYWLCRNAARFARAEEDLPVDQHMLVACVAPRPVYVASGTEDLWADPRGEYLGAYHAGPAYRLLGKAPLADEAGPKPGEALLGGDVGYHLRPGGHSVEPYDWDRFLDFAERHLKKP